MGGISPEAITRLWEEQSAALVLYAQQWCDTPEDIVQEAFLLLVRQTNAPHNPTGWIYRVVRNRAMNSSRSSRRKSRREAVFAGGGQSWFEPMVGDRLDAETASAALSRLLPEQREVIVARIWGGRSFQEIADLTEMSLSTVYRCYQRGLAALRERLGVACPAKKSATKI